MTSPAALIAVLTLAADRGVKKLVVYSDSQLLVRQVNGAYRVKAPHLASLFLQALKLRQTIPDFTIEQRAELPSWLELEVPSQ